MKPEADTIDGFEVKYYDEKEGICAQANFGGIYLCGTAATKEAALAKLIANRYSQKAATAAGLWQGDSVKKYMQECDEE